MLKYLPFVLIFAVFAALFAAPANAWLPHGTPGTCQQATDNGCALANKNASYQPGASLLTSSAQSGQVTLLPSRGAGQLTYNIPAVDYPVGPDKTLTPQDPRNITWSATTPCSYIGTGGNAPPNDYVGCYTSGTYPTAVLDNYDFTGAKIGKTPLNLFLNTDALAGSVITLTNDYFYVPAINTMTIGFGANWSVVFKNSQCDGTNATTSSQHCFESTGDNAGTSLNIDYSAFTNMNVARVIGGLRNTTSAVKHSFIQGLNDLLNDGNHGEVELRTCSQNNCTSAVDYESNFIIWNARPNSSSTQTNATFFPSTGASNEIRFTSMTIKNNVVVTNTQGIPPTPTSSHIMGQALFGQRAASLGVVNITGNWVDASGATGCGVSGAVSGGNSITASTSGNTLTITGLSASFNNFPIDIGWQIFHSGFTTANITAFGTGSGNTGTYTFDGPPQALGSDSSWTVVPGFTSADLTNNWNLADPSHVGTPTAIGFNGPTMRETTCLTLAN